MNSHLVAAIPQPAPQISTNPLHIPAHVTARGDMVGLDQAGLHPALQGSDVDTELARGLAGGDVRHGSGPWPARVAFAVVVSRSPTNAADRDHRGGPNAR